MSTQNEQQQYDFVLRMVLTASFMILVVHVYYLCYDSLELRGLTWAPINTMLLKLNRSYHIFITPV